MKKILYILSAMGLIVSSCSKDIDTDLSSGGDVAASFTNATITRATDEVWAAGDKIGIFAYDEAGAIYNSYENIPYKTEDGGSPASFTPSGTIIYYPTGSSTLSFIAYSPYQESADDGLYEVNLSPQSTTEEVALIDLIVSNDGAEYSNTDPEASLQLNHKLAKLTMTLKDGDGLDASDLVGVEVKLTNIATEGTYDFEDDVFEYDSSDQTITPRTITADSKFEAIIFPYAVAVFDVEFTLTNGKTYTWDLNGEGFTSGKDHAYTVTIAESKISVSSATLSGWGTGVDNDNDLVAIKPWDKSIASGFESGKGSDTEPYIIANGAQLAYLAQQVNDNETYDGVYFKLTNNINLNGNEWTPIGEDETNSFNGIFDGNSQTVSNMSITTGDKYASYCVGLFGCVDGGSLMNITVNGTINLPQHESGDKYIGAVVGYLKSGSVDDISATVTMTLLSGGGSIGEMHVGGAIGKADIELSSNIFSITPTITFKMDCDPDTSKTGLKTVGHNVGWCIDSEKTQSANSPYTKDDSALSLDVGMNVLFNDGIGYSNGYSLCGF